MDSKQGKGRTPEAASANIATYNLFDREFILISPVPKAGDTRCHIPSEARKGILDEAFAQTNAPVHGSYTAPNTPENMQAAQACAAKVLALAEAKGDVRDAYEQNATKLATDDRQKAIAMAGRAREKAAIWAGVMQKLEIAY